MNFSPSNLKKIETLLKEVGYTLRYEKGNFNSGYCILLDMNVIIVNKYFTDDVKFQKLLDLMIDLNVDVRKIATEQSKKTWYKILSMKPSGSEIPLPKDE
jgi:hypothetical protein